MTRRCTPFVTGFAVLALALGGCAGSSDDTGRPDPPEDRPVVSLTYSMSSALDSMTGTERVTFTPDRRVCELVFRAWANKPLTASTGNSLTVRDVRVDGAALPLSVSAAGAPTGRPGTLVTARLPACSPAGTPVTADLSYAVTLGAGTDERIGYSPRDRIAWLGTAFPLLAWQRGVGWVTDPAVAVVGESATSEAFRLERLQVVAPAQDVVSGVGQEQGEPSSAPDGRRVHTFSADAVRDVTVTVGNIVRSTAKVGDTDIVLSLPRNGSRATAQEWTSRLTAAVTALEARFGPMPFPSLWISVLPAVTDGVEYPGAVQFSDVDPARERWLILHELAHMYFYGLVGNDQGRDPWLDEAFATYAEELVSATPNAADCRPAPSGVGRSLASFAGGAGKDDDYVDTVYEGGACALHRARAAGGAEAFDQAVREYMRTRAWTVAQPADLAYALRDLPEAVAVLRRAGALPPAAGTGSGVTG
ncbi:hypothetical protein [Agilicoccus flavus]|uniref:hypothetical protein n=1 Tax=Agilicoccus flavus TaxID=2775968 RepID=UPI001CF66722|nr:hypothetical protein [Agilicoccus flavus]